MAGGSGRSAPRSVIRLLERDDAEELAALYRANREFLRPFEPARPDEFFTTAVQRRRIERIGNDLWRWAIVDEGRIVGMIALADVIREPLQLANIGYWVDRGHNGRGLATQAVADVVRFAFSEAALHRLEAGTLPDNFASQRVLEKNGFVQFGLAHKLLQIDGVWRDHVLFELVND
jgi:[ribosomal protein S5]-alanine N-acetyltransferase